MNNCILVMGESGTGKSHSIRYLDPGQTFIINVLDKPLPFKGFKKNYRYFPGKIEDSNYIACDEARKIITTIEWVNKNKPLIKNIIIDDFQYIMANQFMRKALEKGYDKFTEIGQQAWLIIRSCMQCRDDLYVFIMSHTETDNFGRSKCKTIGRMLDDKITLEGMFTVVLHSLVADGRYKFLTRNDGTHIAKSPLDMFSTPLIDNDLKSVKEKISVYLGEDIENELEVKGEAA